MGRAARNRPGPLGGNGNEKHGARGSDNRHKGPADPELDPERDSVTLDEEAADQVDNEYIWPSVEEEEDY
jgi:hypothetical protein